MTNFGRQATLDELKPTDYAMLQGKITWLSIVERDEEGVVSRVHGDIVGRTSLVTRVREDGDENVHAYSIMFAGMEDDPFRVTLPSDSDRTVLIAVDLDS